MPALRLRHECVPCRYLPIPHTGALIAHLVEFTDNGLKVNIAMTERHKVPSPPGIAKLHMGAQKPGTVVMAQAHILQVNMIDVLCKVTQKNRRIYALP